LKLTTSKKTTRVLAVSGLALALGLGLLSPLAHLSVKSSGAAWAAEDGDGSEGGKGKGQKGQAEGKGNQGGQKGQGNQGGNGKGQGGPSADSDGKGPQAGGPSADGSSGGKPVWAQEGIPEVELGRLNVARSPDKVLDRALAEALKTVPDAASFYNQSLDDMIADFSLEWDTITIVDAPLQNLALLRESLLDPAFALPGVTTDTSTLQAVFLGVASDKAVPITPDTVVAVTTILGAPITGDAAAALAADAEAVRIAVVAGHDS
jgi:hypothetical protein